MARRPSAGDKLPRRKKPRPTRKRKRGDFAGLVGVLCAAATAMVAAALGVRHTKNVRDRKVLNGMLAKPLHYTEHAVCRMDCRHITQGQVIASLQKGKINDRKSNMRMQPCPKVVVDSVVGQAKRNVQAVFSACAVQTDVVTVIDKDKDWICYCP